MMQPFHLVHNERCNRFIVANSVIELLTAKKRENITVSIKNPEVTMTKKKRRYQTKRNANYSFFNDFLKSLFEANDSSISQKTMQREYFLRKRCPLN
jgi:hypothetical protein